MTRRLGLLCLLAAAPLLALGWILPIMTVTSFWVIEAEHSIVGGLGAFWRDGEWLLILAIALFAILFPAAKIAVGFWAWADPKAAAKALKLAAAVSKWSMLDVFVVALVVMTAKASIVADASVGPGAWCFAGAALGSTLALAGFAKGTSR